MSFIRVLKILGILTIVSLVYIHMHMQIIDFAYQGKQKESTIRHLKEDKQLLTFAILNLKSANHIGLQLLAKDSDMEFVSPHDVVEISSPPQSEEKTLRSLAASQESKGRKFLSWLSLANPVEAKSVNRR